MYTMSQLRNVFFACLNKSTLTERMGINEDRHKKIHEKCLELDEIDKQMKTEFKDMN